MRREKRVKRGRVLQRQGWNQKQSKWTSEGRRGRIIRQIQKNY